MAEQYEDPFASAKDNLRETVKWLATIFAGLAAVVVAGASLTGLSDASGVRLMWALGGGGIALICIFVAIGVSLNILAAEPFFLGQLKTDKNLNDALQQHAVDVLPPEFSTVDSFLTERESAIRVALAKGNSPEDPEYVRARDFLLKSAAPFSRLTSLAHLQSLRSRFAAAKPMLFALAIFALAGLGVFAVFAGDSDAATEGAGELAVELDVGTDWSNVAAAFAAACGEAATHSARLVRQADRNWVSVRLTSPDKCDGVVVSLPAAVVVRAELPGSP